MPHDLSTKIMLCPCAHDKTERMGGELVSRCACVFFVACLGSHDGFNAVLRLLLQALKKDRREDPRPANAPAEPRPAAPWDPHLLLRRKRCTGTSKRGRRTRLKPGKPRKRAMSDSSEHPKQRDGIANRTASRSLRSIMDSLNAVRLPDIAHACGLHGSRCGGLATCCDATVEGLPVFEMVAPASLEALLSQDFVDVSAVQMARSKSNQGSQKSNQGSPAVGSRSG